MSHATVHNQQQGSGEHGQGEVLSVSMPAGRRVEPLPVAAQNDSRSTGPRPIAGRIGFGFFVPIKVGEASLASLTLRDIEFAIVEKLKGKGFDWN